MTSILRSVCILATALTGTPGLFAQDLVDHEPHLRNVLLEEYSAVNCGNCPAGHDLADQIIASHPGRVIAVEVHGGVLADPGAGQPDFRTTDGAALWSFYAVASQPRGAVDRIPQSEQVVVGTGLWASAANAALQLSSPVNLGMTSSFDEVTRLLTVNVELYYTADGSLDDRIGVLLKEDHIIGYQQDYVNGPHADYDHLNVLRGYITDLWGDAVGTATMGTTVMRTYTYTVPAEWDMANCDVVAFVGPYQGEIDQVRSIDAIGTTTGIEEADQADDVRVFPVPSSDQLNFILPLEISGGVLRIVDATGRTVQAEQLAGGISHQLDVSGYGAGTYLYSITSAEDTRMGRFVVAR